MKLAIAAILVHVVCLGTFLGWPPFAPEWAAWIVLAVGLLAIPAGIYGVWRDSRPSHLR